MIYRDPNDHEFRNPPPLYTWLVLLGSAGIAIWFITVIVRVLVAIW